MEQLELEGFKPLDAWTSPASRVHRHSHIHHQPGLYAFVVDGVVCYVGQAERLHRRLRNYSNRCFGAAQGKDPRACHVGIVEAIGSGRHVHVWVRPMPVEDLDAEEMRLRNELQPAWDRTAAERRVPTDPAL